MSDGMLLQIRDDGTAELYDDTYDITIHCTSQEEQDAARVLLKRAGAIPHWISQDNIPRWIPCSEKLPDSDDKVLCQTVTKKGAVGMMIGYYGYGRWCCGMNSNVVAWMKLPEPYVPEGGTNGA